jgi:hypothetical protein
MFVFYLWFLLFLRWSCYVVQATSSLWPSCFNLPSSAGITCIHYCSQLQFFFFLFFFFFFFVVLGVKLRAYTTLWAILPAVFCDGFFQDRVSWTVCLGWLWTMILLISASWEVPSTNFFKLEISKNIVL